MGVTLGILMLVGGAAVALVGLAQRPEPALEAPDDYLRSLDAGEEGDEFTQLLAEPFVTRVLRPLAGGALGALGGLLPGNYREEIQAKLLYAGLAGRFRAEEIISLQAIGAVVGFLLAVGLNLADALGGNVGILLLVLLPALGAWAPRSWLDRKVDERRDEIRRDLPDTLDLMAISVEAGMGFEGALGVVCDNFDSPLADEFARTLREMELGLPRREALHNLKRRTEVPELSNFVLTLTQADALGMPIGRVLKTTAGEMRMKRRQWAREKAAKLPVKMLFPLVLFIFPAIFVVLLGPAAADIGRAFG
jgi:tight adherence protein C